MPYQASRWTTDVDAKLSTTNISNIGNLLIYQEKRSTSSANFFNMLGT
jgi:hypothetical protein